MTKWIDPASLRAEGGELRRIGGAIGQAVKTLETATTQTNSPWGGDDLGTIFGSLYNPLAQRAFEFYREAGTAVEELGGWLDKRAKDDDVTERENDRKVREAGGN